MRSHNFSRVCRIVNSNSENEICSKMGLRNSVPTTAKAEDKDHAIALLDEMKRFRDDELKPNSDCRDGVPILDEKTMSGFINVTNIAEELMKKGERGKIDKHFDEFQAYFCVVSVSALIKNFNCYVQKKWKFAESEEHNDRLTRIKEILDKVKRLLAVNEEKVNNLDKLMLSILASGAQQRDLIAFGLIIGYVSADLESCTSYLMVANRELNEGFSAVKKDLFWRVVNTSVSALGDIGRFTTIHLYSVHPLMRLVGTSCTPQATGIITAGAGVAYVVGCLAYIAYVVWQEIAAPDEVYNKYKDFEFEKKNLEINLANLKKKIEECGLAKKLVERDNEINRLRAQLMSSNRQQVPV